VGDERRERERTAGAFLGPYGTTPVPIRTLSDEIPGEPSDLEAERRGRRDGDEGTAAAAASPRESLLARLRRALRVGSRRPGG
jgi:hypothetical protein